MPVFRIQTLGEVRLTREAGDPVALRRKPLALLAYLARRAPRVVPRSELTTLLWGERTEERARQSLRQALVELRQAVGDVLEATPDGVRLANGVVALDLAEFECDAREGRDESAAARWRGDFFANAAEIGGDGFERWVESERTLALRRLGAVMERLVGGAELRADWEGAAAWAARWAAAAPFDERAHARLVETLRMRGRAVEALDRHADFVARIRAALDIEPSPEFLRLAGGLQEQARTEAARRARPSTGVRAPTLVGRGHELAELAAAWRSACAGTPALVLVDDEGGGGKTRLCDELALLATERTERAVGAETPARAVVLRAAGVAPDDAAGAAAPEQGHATARRLFAALGDAPGSAGASPEALAECARVIPSLAAMFRHLPAPTGDETALGDALVQLLAAVAEEMPVLVLLDDAHCADPGSLRLIAAVAGRLPGGVALVLFGDASGRAGGAALDALLAVPGLVRVRLHPLGAHEVETMLASMANIAEEDRTRLAARLYVETRGVPLLVHETVAALVDERLLTLDHAGEWRVSPTLEGRPLPLPTTILERVRTRFASLSPAARALLDTAAVLGTPIDSVLLESVAELSPAEAAAGLRELSGRRIVREEPATGEVDFGHPVLGRAAYALLSPSERQARHARAAAELAARDLTTTAERSVLPYHLARAGSRGTPRLAADSSPSIGADRARAPRGSSLLRRAMFAAAGLVVLAALTPGVLWVVGRLTGATGAFDAGTIAPDVHRVMVGAFENRSGRAELDRVRDVAVDWVVRGLDETGLVEIVGAPAAPVALAMRERGGAAVLATDDPLRIAARAAHVGMIVTGTLDQRGDTVVLAAMLVDARDGSLLRALTPVRADAADPLAGIERLRREIVGALAALVDPRYDPGDDARPPPSYEAYLALIRGEEAANSGATERAVAEYRTAAGADSTYALPLLRLAMASFQAGQCERVDSIVALVERRRVPLSRFEGHDLDRVGALCRSDWEAANDAARRMADLSPRSQRAQFAAGLSAASVNRPREALRRLRRIDPARGWTPAEGRYWMVLAFVLHMAGDDEGLRELPGRVEGAQRDFFSAAGVAYAAAALGRAEEFERAASELIAVGRRMDAGRLTFLVPMVDELRVHGSRADAAAVATRLAAQIGAGIVPGAAGDTGRYVQAELLYRAERWADARALIDPLVERHAHNVFVVSLAGRAAARLGDSAAARRTSEALEGLSAPALRGADSYAQAQLAALLGEREAAVRLLQRAVAQGVPYTPELGTAYLGHADVDLESVLGEPEVQMMLRRRD